MNRPLAKSLLLITIIFMAFASQSAAAIFVSSDGDDGNDGSIENPFATIAHALTKITTGDTIWVRGGVYELTSRITIGTDRNGEANALNHLFAYTGERPVLDFTNQAFGSAGMSLKASYWYLHGIDIKSAGDNGLIIDGGSYNIIEMCNFYENRDTGLQLSNGAANNQIINCDSYYNADPPDYGDADGFAPKLTVGSGNYFFGCRAWGNCDDGWDGYLRGADDVTTTLENCWTWGNGYLKDGTDPGEKANGNGFKMGGGDNSNLLLLRHHMNLTNCLAFENKNKGFDQNNNAGSMTLINCTGYNNLAADYRIQKDLKSGETLILKNCVAYLGAVELGDFAIQEANSWLPGFDVTAEDFVTLDFSDADAPRNPDGSLPETGFMHLARGSDLIDAGVDVGLPYNGIAPDLGAFESNYPSGLQMNDHLPEQLDLHQNFPNPFNPVTIIPFTLPERSDIRLTIYDLSGKKVLTLAEGALPAGRHHIAFNGGDLASGMYTCVLITDNHIRTIKITLIK